MRRGIQSTMVIALVVILPILWIFRPVWPLPARFGEADCRHIGIAEVGSARSVRGIEDMALLPDGDTLILSAYDRLAREAHPSSAIEGGLYEVSVSRLSASPSFASEIVPEGAVPGGLFPQGIAVSSDGKRLAFINRNRDGTVSIIGGALTPGSFQPEAERTDPALCRANDLDFTGDGEFTLEITLDRVSCGLAWSDLKPGSTSGRVVTLDLQSTDPPVISREGLAFANGIAGLYVAETRADRLSHSLEPPLYLPGGPDDLNWDPLGGLIVAVHPSLMRFAAYRFGLIGHAPSRIVRVDLDRHVEVLFDDPGGEIFSGATSAVLVDGTLVAGSVRDTGVLVCSKGIS